MAIIATTRADTAGFGSEAAGCHVDPVRFTPQSGHARTHLTVICADLRGYGRSGCPASGPDHAPYAKRAMANDMVSVMGKLGLPRFSVAGHDRGGRVAYRLALDHPDRVERLALLDILPTAETWER